MSKASTIRSVIYGVLIALVLFEAFDFLGGYDYIKASAYQPTDEMKTIIEGLDLTDRGQRIYKATSPNLDSRDVFNEKCDSHNKEVYVLGCYLTGDDVIHLYNVEESELSGIKEATAAHELLHAVYNRLPFWEKSSLNGKMKKVYDELSDDNDIKESMKLYGENDFYDELHSRLGTEIKELPQGLEDHYAAIFNNQDKIVDYYNQYSDTFKKLEDEVNSIAKRLGELQKSIDDEESRLQTTSTELNKRIEDYNSRVRAHNYTSENVIIAEGEKLQAEINTINAAYDSLNKSIDEYNNLIVEYNNSVVHTNKVFNSINSNSERIETINN